MNPKEALKITDKSRRIQGWFSTEAAMLFAWFDEIQKSNGIEGDIFEIGVHHGKSAVLLGAMVKPQKEILGVCDLFGEQKENVSSSGLGDRQIFEKNMNLFFHDKLKLQIFAKSSKNLNPQEIGNNYRFFHIDGGHDEDEALNDLKLAANSIIEKGVIVIDDPFRSEWPGVSEAIIYFLDSNKNFCAIVVGFNKMFIVRCDIAHIYLSEIENTDQRQTFQIVYPWRIKELPFMGYSLRIFYMKSKILKMPPLTRILNLYYKRGWHKNPLLKPLESFAKSISHKNMLI